MNRQRRRHWLMLALRTPIHSTTTGIDLMDTTRQPTRFTWCATVQIHFEASLMCCESSRHVNLSIAFCSLHFRFCFSLRSQTGACDSSCTQDSFPLKTWTKKCVSHSLDLVESATATAITNQNGVFLFYLVYSNRLIYGLALNFKLIFIRGKCFKRHWRRLNHTSTYLSLEPRTANHVH